VGALGRLTCGVIAGVAWVSVDVGSSLVTRGLSASALWGVVLVQALPYEGDQLKAPMMLPCLSRTAAVSRVRAVWRPGFVHCSGRCRTTAISLAARPRVGSVGGAQPPQDCGRCHRQHTDALIPSLRRGWCGTRPHHVHRVRTSEPTVCMCRRARGTQPMNSATNPSAGSVKILSELSTGGVAPSAN